MQSKLDFLWPLLTRPCKYSAKRDLMKESTRQTLDPSSTLIPGYAMDQYQRMYIVLLALTNDLLQYKKMKQILNIIDLINMYVAYS